MNNIHIIGGGNLGASGFRIAKFSSGHKVTVTRRNVNKIKHLEDLLSCRYRYSGCRCYTIDNKAVSSRSSISGDFTGDQNKK
jgi:alanine dehydrogenase